MRALSTAAETGRQSAAGTLSERAAAVRECDCGNCNNVPLGRPGGSVHAAMWSYGTDGREERARALGLGKGGKLKTFAIPSSLSLSQLRLLQASNGFLN